MPTHKQGGNAPNKTNFIKINIEYCKILSEDIKKNKSNSCSKSLIAPNTEIMKNKSLASTSHYQSTDLGHKFAGIPTGPSLSNQKDNNSSKYMSTKIESIDQVLDITSLKLKSNKTKSKEIDKALGVRHLIRGKFPLKNEKVSKINSIIGGKQKDGEATLTNSFNISNFLDKLKRKMEIPKQSELHLNINSDKINKDSQINNISIDVAIKPALLKNTDKIENTIINLKKEWKLQHATNDKTSDFNGSKGDNSFNNKFTQYIRKQKDYNSTTDTEMKSDNIEQIETNNKNTPLPKSNISKYEPQNDGDCNEFFKISATKRIFDFQAEKKEKPISMSKPKTSFLTTDKQSPYHYQTCQYHWTDDYHKYNKETNIPSIKLASKSKPYSDYVRPIKLAASKDEIKRLSTPRVVANMAAGVKLERPRPITSKLPIKLNYQEGLAHSAKKKLKTKYKMLNRAKPHKSKKFINNNKNVVIHKKRNILKSHKLRYLKIQQNTEDQSTVDFTKPHTDFNTFLGNLLMEHKSYEINPKEKKEIARHKSEHFYSLIKQNFKDCINRQSEPTSQSNFMTSPSYIDRYYNRSLILDSGNTNHSKSHSLILKKLDTECNDVLRFTRNELKKLGLKGYVLGNKLQCNQESMIFQAKYKKCNKNLNLVCKVVDKSSQTLTITKFLPRELQIIRSLHHPNVIHVHSILDQGTKLFIFFPYAQHGNLLDFIRGYGALRELHTRIWFKQIASGAKYLHENNIVHRDLKCENILITRSYKLKIANFCLSRLYPTEKKSQTMSETYCGTAAYSAPEVITCKPYNPKLADIWSLGVILFVMLNGSLPFNDTNVFLQVKNQVTKNWMFRSQLKQIISQPAMDLIGHCLEPNVSLRYTINDIITSDFICLDTVVAKGNSTSFVEHYLNNFPGIFCDPFCGMTHIPPSAKDDYKVLGLIFRKKLIEKHQPKTNIIENKNIKKTTNKSKLKENNIKTHKELKQKKNLNSEKYSKTNPSTTIHKGKVIKKRSNSTSTLKFTSC